MNKHVTAALISKSPSDGSGVFEAVVYDGAAGDTDGVIITAAGMRSAVDAFHRRGRNLVLRWNHDMGDPDAALGVISDVRVVGTTLVVRGRLDLTNEKSQRVYEAMLAGRLNEFSIGWVVPQGGAREKDGLIFVDAMELVEVSAVAAGANRGTRLVAVKSAPAREADGEQTFPIREALRKQLAELVSSVTVPRSVTDDERVAFDRYVGELRAELAAKRAREKARAAEMDRVRKRLNDFQIIANSRPRPRVAVDGRFRVVKSDELEAERERDAERAAVEEFDREHRERERAEDAAAVESLRDRVHGGDDNPVATYMLGQVVRR